MFWVGIAASTKAPRHPGLRSLLCDRVSVCLRNNMGVSVAAARRAFAQGRGHLWHLVGR